ncbi:MAG: hypothetical protein WCO28_02625 [Bacteroidota bacterium]
MKKICLLFVIVLQSILLFGQYNGIPTLPEPGHFSIKYIKNFMNRYRPDVHSIFMNSDYKLKSSDENSDDFIYPNSLVSNGVTYDLFVLITYNKSTRKCDLISWNTHAALFRQIKYELNTLGFYETGSEGYSICYKNSEDMEVCLEINPNTNTLLVNVAMPKQKHTNQKKSTHKK